MAGPLASLEILLRLSKAFVIVWFILEVISFIWKGTVLPYPNSDLGAEVVLIIIVPFMELLRMSFLRRGNLTESQGPLVAGIVVSIPVFVAYLYLILWQTYVLRLERLICAISFVLLALTVILAIVAMVSVASNSRHHQTPTAQRSNR